jgi:hypothetical protein
VERAAGGVLPGRGGVESFSPTPMLLAMRHFPEGTQGQSYWYHLDGRGSVAGISPSTRARARTTTGMMLTARFCRLRATGRTRTTITPLRAKSGMSTWACMNLAFGCMTPGRGCGGRGSRCRGMPGSPARGTATSMRSQTRSVIMTRMGCRRRRLIRQRPGPHRPPGRRPRQRLRRHRSPGPRRRGRLHQRRRLCRLPLPGPCPLGLLSVRGRLPVGPTIGHLTSL